MASIPDDFKEILDRNRQGYKSMCASIDLLGMKDYLLEEPKEASARLNDLQKLPEALMFFPGGEQYRACFVGDSWFIVREVEPDADIKKLWPDFCGHMFALASFAHEIEVKIGNPGIRAVAAYGDVSPIIEPQIDLNPELKEQVSNWFSLTGADQAVVKCIKADSLGQDGGFKHKIFWHESLENEFTFLGSHLSPVSSSEYSRYNLYEWIFNQMMSNIVGTTRMKK